MRQSMQRRTEREIDFATGERGLFYSTGLFRAGLKSYDYSTVLTRAYLTMGLVIVLPMRAAV